MARVAAMARRMLSPASEMSRAPYTKVSFKTAPPACEIPEPPMPADPTISVIDDDASVREALEAFLRSAGFRTQSFASAEQFLDSGRLEDTACLILDVRMPGMSGVELQERLIAAGSAVPIIFISAHSDEDARARALERGAVEFFRKPFPDDALLGAIARAVGAAAH